MVLTPWLTVGEVKIPLQDYFRKFAARVSKIAGSAWAFVVAMIAIFVWGLTGPVFNFSTNWQLTINSVTTIVTFLMVFLIQNTQNRDSKALHLKLDELLRSSKGARNTMVDIEELSDEELERIHIEFQGVRSRYEKILAQRAKAKSNSREL